MSEIVSVISIIAAIGGVVFGVTTIFRNKKQDDTKDGKESGIVLTELGYIKSSLDDIKQKQDRADGQIVGFLRELTAVQESVKSLHHRLDGLERRINE